MLQIAAILHDTGKFINTNNHYNHSYDIVIASSIIGISDIESHIIANICRYHSSKAPEYSHANFKILNKKSRIIAAKLIAILRLADSLDISHKQKISKIDLVSEDKTVIIKAYSIEDLSLEQWRFDNKSIFFGEVFGVTPILKIVKNINVGR